MAKVASPEQLRQRLKAIPFEELRGSDIGYFDEAEAHLRRACECASSNERTLRCLCAEALIAAVEAGLEIVGGMVESAQMACK